MFQLFRWDLTLHYRSSSKCSHRLSSSRLVIWNYMSECMQFNRLWSLSEDLSNCMSSKWYSWSLFILSRHRLRQSCGLSRKWSHHRKRRQLQFLHSSYSTKKSKLESHLKNQSWHNSSHCSSLRQCRRHTVLPCFRSYSFKHRSEYSDQSSPKHEDDPINLNIDRQYPRSSPAFVLQTIDHSQTSSKSLFVA